MGFFRPDTHRLTSPLQIFALPHTLAAPLMRLFSRALTAVLLLAPLTAPAQTYTPQTIRIDAPPAVDTAEALRIAALPTNAPLTKQQIEAALQRIADTGLFSDVGYTVDATALVIKLTPSASSQLQPAHFSNFIWWQPAELESLLEAAVPGYHGQLPVAGTLTDQVKAALVALLHAKGVDATVDAHENGFSADAVTLSIVSPSIVIGEVHLQNTLAPLLPQLKALQHRLHGEDFDIAETTKTVQDSVNDIYQNAGYLAVDTSAPTYSAPHKDLLTYAVDLSTSITPGEVYHVASISIHAQPPVSEADLAKAANIKIGDVASLAAQRLALSEMQQVYTSQGYFDAKVLFTLHQDNGVHTVEYACNFVPGEIYHFASIDTSALALDQQAAFARAFTVAPGAIANNDLRSAVSQALQSLHLSFPVGLNMVANSKNHTVKIILKTSASPAH
jgi:outer membrane protein assembly factor BamA